MALQPGLDLGMLVGRIVIRDQMNLLALRGLSVNETQEFDPLLMTVSWHTGPNHRPVQRIECREQSSSPVALVVMGHRATATWHEWQSWLRSVECLNLALLIDREHQGMLGGIQVKTNDIVQLLYELRISAQLERSRQMRLQAVTPPNTANRARAEPRGFGQTAGAPVSSGCRSLLRRLAYDLLRVDPTPPPGPRSILQEAGHPLFGKATTPNSNGSARHPADLSDLLILLAFSGQEDDSRSLCHTHGNLPAPRKLLKLFPLLGRKNYRDSHLHLFPPRGISHQERITDVPEYRTHYTS